jgi:hypothetical protein
MMPADAAAIAARSSGGNNEATMHRKLKGHLLAGCSKAFLFWLMESSWPTCDEVVMMMETRPDDVEHNSSLEKLCC